MKIIHDASGWHDAQAIEMVAQGRGSFSFIYGDTQTRFRLFSKAIHWDRVLLAYFGDEVVGFVAFQWKRRGPYSLAWNDFSAEFGFCSGSWRWLVHAVLEMRTWCRNLYVYGLKVKPGVRRQGVASTLLQEMEVHARQLGAKQIELDVYESNQAAIALYQSRDYDIGRKRNMRLLQGFMRHSAIFQMLKSLS